MPWALMVLTPPHAAGAAASEPSVRSTISAGTNCAAAAAAAAASAPRALHPRSLMQPNTAFNLTELPSVACGLAYWPPLSEIAPKPPARCDPRTTQPYPMY